MDADIMQKRVESMIYFEPPQPSGLATKAPKAPKPPRTGKLRPYGADELRGMDVPARGTRVYFPRRSMYAIVLAPGSMMENPRDGCAKIGEGKEDLADISSFDFTQFTVAVDERDPSNLIKYLHMPRVGNNEQEVLTNSVLKKLRSKSAAREKWEDHRVRACASCCFRDSRLFFK